MTQSVADTAALFARDLRTDGVVDPLGIDATAPTLSWKVATADAGRRGCVQSGYRVAVAAEADPVADGVAPCWDSGDVRSSESAGVSYGGTALESGTRYQWRVRLADADGVTGAWSEPAVFETALLQSAEWTAGWIGSRLLDEVARDPGASLETTRPGPPLRRIWPTGQQAATTAYFRVRFSAGSGARILGATVTLAGSGQMSGYLGGVPISTVGDVSAAVQPGENVLAVVVRDAQIPGLLGRLQVWLQGERSHGVDTDGRWRAVAQAAPGWESPDFNDSDWPLAEGIGYHGEPPGGREPVSYRPAPYLRREFSLDGEIARARIYATALGVYELRCNGERVGTDQLAPGWTNYHRRVPYQTYDVTELLREGDNVLGGLLGDGWYAGNVCWLGQFQYGRSPSLRAQLHVRYTDGRTETVGTDEHWQAIDGPIRYADLQNGAVIDRRAEPVGWDRPGWSGPQRQPGDVDTAVVRAPRHGVLRAATAPAIRVMREIPAVSVTTMPGGAVIIDFGQNLVGWVRLSLRGRAGERVIVRHAEVLRSDGELYTTALRSASATDEYLLRGNADGESVEPVFTVHGFRYAEISGYSGVLTTADVTARVVYADMPRAGHFECSNPDVNRLQHNIVWGQRGNFLSVPTDCPQRDERLGWTGDAQVFAATAAFNYDVRGFFRKWLTDLTDAQRPSGAITHVAPDVLTPAMALRDPLHGLDAGSEQAGAAGWGDAVAVIPAEMCKIWADRHAVEQTYAAVRHWVDYLTAHSTGHIRPAAGFNDWLAIVPTPGDLVGTAWYAYACSLGAELAGILGDDAGVRALRQRYGLIRQAFRERYVDGGGRIDSGATESQTGYVLALAFGLFDDVEKPRALARLVADIELHNDHLTTGFLGTPYLLDVLSAGGRLDVAYRLLLQDTFPSWLYPVVHGDATTMWERWDSWSDSRGFQDPGMTSFNHYAYGAVGDWVYRTVGGIEPIEEGYARVRVRPRPGGGISWAQTSFDSVYGVIAVSWRIETDGAFTLSATIPPNTSAEIWVPAGDASAVSEEGGATASRQETGSVIFEVGSGSYSFTARH